jgi:hypothetical protein
LKTSNQNRWSLQPQGLLGLEACNWKTWTSLTPFQSTNFISESRKKERSFEVCNARATKISSSLGLSRLQEKYHSSSFCAVITWPWRGKHEVEF